MKVLIFSWEYPPHMVGGLGQHVYDLSRFLAACGQNVHVITPRVKGAPDYEVACGVTIHRVGSPNSEADEKFKSWVFTFNSEAIRKAVRINSEVGGFNVVHAHDWLAAYAGRSVAKIFDIALVTTIHATEHGRNLGLHNRMQREINEIEKNLAIEADKVICCSRYMQEEITCLFGVNKEEITIIPNGVEPEQFIPLPQKPQVDLESDKRVVCFIGRLVPEKGIWQLLGCFSQVLEKVPDAKLVIGGRGPQKKILEDYMRKLGISDKVIFAGFLKNEQRNYLYQKANVAVFPSLYEPFGIVALEAMATKTPVIVGNTGGLSEIIKDRINGLKVSPGDEGELANAIIELLTEQELADELQSNAWQEVQNTYSWDAIARATIEVYKEAINIAKEKKEVG